MVHEYFANFELSALTYEYKALEILVTLSAIIFK